MVCRYTPSLIVYLTIALTLVYNKLKQPNNPILVVSYFTNIYKIVNFVCTVHSSTCGLWYVNCDGRFLWHGKSTWRWDHTEEQQNAWMTKALVLFDYKKKKTFRLMDFRSHLVQDDHEDRRKPIRGPTLSLQITYLGRWWGPIY